MTVTIGELALVTPVTVGPLTLIRDAEQQLIRQEAPELYIVDEQHRLVGAVTESDLLNYRLLGGDGETGIAALATPVAIFLAPADTLRSATQLLCRHSAAYVPVVDRGRLIGAFQRSRLLKMLSAGELSLSEYIAEEELRALSFAPLQLIESHNPSRPGWQKESA